MALNIQSAEERLAEVDRVIMNTSSKGCEMLRNGDPIAAVDSMTEFLRSLYRRRDLILWELKKAGITEAEAYAHLRSRKETANELDQPMA